MRKKLFISLIFLTLFLAVSCVSASDNATHEIQSVDADISNPVLGEVDSNQDSQMVAANSKNTTPQTASKISASKVTGYESFTTKFVVNLAIGGKKVSDKKVSISVNNKTYTRSTNADGQAILNVNLAKGTYDVKYSYAGDKNTKPSSGTSKITIKQAIKTSIKVGDKAINYRQGLKSVFYVKLTDANGVPVKAQTVTFKVAGKKYTARTTSAGNAAIYLSLKKGNYKVSYSFAKTKPYLSSSGSFKIHVRAPMAKGNGYWMWPAHMSSTSLKALASSGTKHIFLESYAVSAYGKSYVTSWIKEAHRYGIKVHLWICVCSDGENWVSPVRDDGSFKLGFIKQKVADAVRYAKISGVDGIHLDYMRYGGTAHKHINAIQSINYIVKKISTAVHKVKPNCIVSVAIMPEPSMMHYYYGQDVPTLSKYVDALIPMVYKGNYGKNTKWIRSVTSTFVKQSMGAQIWTGLQSYGSDYDASPLSYNELFKDAKAAVAGGATGVVLFRIGLSCNLNFKKL